MNPETRALIVWLLEAHTIAVVHGMMRRNPKTAPVEHQQIRSIRRSMLRNGADHRTRGSIRTMPAEAASMIWAMLENSSPAQVFQTLQANVTGQSITLNEIKMVRRDMLAAGAPHVARPGPAPRFTREELADRKRNRGKLRAREIRARNARLRGRLIVARPMPVESFVDTEAYGSNLLLQATEAMFARKAERLGCSHEAARLSTLYSPAQLTRRLAA